MGREVFGTEAEHALGPLSARVVYRDAWRVRRVLRHHRTKTVCSPRAIARSLLSAACCLCSASIRSSTEGPANSERPTS